MRMLKGEVMSDDSGGCLTLDELKAKHPDLLQELEAEVRANLIAKARRSLRPGACHRD